MTGFTPATVALIWERDAGCSIDGCEKPFYALKLCKMHHQRQWVHGSTDPRPRKSTKRPVRERLAKYMPTERQPNGCEEWRGRTSVGGYGQFWLDGKTRIATRVIWELEHGPIPDGLFVRHKCDNPPCVRLDHLELGTPAENSRDKVIRGRSLAGSTNPSAHLDEVAVAAIRAAIAAGERVVAVAARYGISRTQAYRIKRGESWGSVT